MVLSPAAVNTDPARLVNTAPWSMTIDPADHVLADPPRENAFPSSATEPLMVAPALAVTVFVPPNVPPVHVSSPVIPIAAFPSINDPLLNTTVGSAYGP